MCVSLLLITDVSKINNETPCGLPLLDTLYYLLPFPNDSCWSHCNMANDSPSELPLLELSLINIFLPAGYLLAATNDTIRIKYYIEQGTFSAERMKHYIEQESSQLRLCEGLFPVYCNSIKIEVSVFRLTLNGKW